MTGVLILMLGLLCWQAAPVDAQEMQVQELLEQENAEEPERGRYEIDPQFRDQLTPQEIDTLENFDWKRLKITEGMKFSEILEIWLEPKPYLLAKAVIIDDKHARPHPNVNLVMEIVKQEGNLIWLRGLPPEDPQSAMHRLWMQVQASEIIKKEALAEGPQFTFVDFGDVPPPPFADALSFEEVHSGLPTGGRWQENFVFADMNGDGLDDIVAPPLRKGPPNPWIFLNFGDGNFEVWQKMKWTNEVPYDYGSVAVADFDGDGNNDVALAIHFKAQYVLYGNGQGEFLRATRLKSPDPRVTSRAVTTADFNGDGRPDLAFLAELNMDMGKSDKVASGRSIWLQLNDPEWGFVLGPDVLESVELIGDAIAAPDVNADGLPDLITGVNTNNWRGMVYLNQGEQGWTEAESSGVLQSSYHFDVAFAPAGVKGQNTLFATYLQFKTFRDTTVSRTGIVAYPVEDGALRELGTPLVIRKDRIDAYQRIGVGDLNNDGLADVVGIRKSGIFEAYVQTPSGEFYLERSPEVESLGRPYDIQLRDLNGDGMDDIVIATVPIHEKTPETSMEALSATEGEIVVKGGLRVLLTRSRTGA